MTRTVYCADLRNSAGSLDMFSADDLETLTRHLGKRLLTRQWLLRDGDTIHIIRSERNETPSV